MFAKLAATLVVALSTFSTSVAAAPTAASTSELGMEAFFITLTFQRNLTFSRPSLVARDPSQSFNNWGGISSLSGFDNFYGSGNFDNSHFSQSSITVVKQQEVVCRSESIEIIQQRLLILQEVAKR